MFPYVGNKAVTRAYIGALEVPIYGGLVPEPAGHKIYMSPNGADANDGSTRALAVKSLSRASALVSAGSTVIVMAGVYTGVQQFYGVGTAQNPIVIQPDSGAHVVFDGTGSPANTTLIDLGGEYVVFRGFEVRNSTRSGIQTWEAHHITIAYNKVHTCVKGGIWLGGSAPVVPTDAAPSHDNVVEYNEVYNCVRENIGQAMGGGGWAVALQVGMDDNSVIRGNYVHDNYGEGIGVLGTIGADIIDNVAFDNFSVNIYNDNGRDSIIQRNVSYHTRNPAFYRTTPAQGPAYGIIIVNEADTGRDLPSSGILATNNIVVDSAVLVSYSTFGSNTGLVSSTIVPNAYYDTYAAYKKAFPNG